MAAASITTPQCTVCQHANRVQIDHLLAAGSTGRATARRFGLSKDAISRHFRDHVGHAFKASIRAGPFGSEENLRKLVADGQVNNLETLQAYRAIIGSRIVATAEVGADAALAAMLKAGHDNVALYARITGGLAPEQKHVTFSILQDPRTMRFATRVLDLARKFPEARSDITELVRECFGADDGRPLLDVTPEAASG